MNISHKLTKDRLKRLGFEEGGPGINVRYLGWHMRISDNEGRTEVSVYQNGDVWLGTDCDEYDSHSVCLTNPPKSVEALKKFCHYFGIKLKSLTKLKVR